MRISTRPDDPGYANFQKLQGQDITVTRDGVEIPANQLVTADEEEGYTLRVLVHEATGDPVLYEGELAQMPEYGEVKITVAVRPYNAADAIRRHQEHVKKLMHAVVMDLHVRAQVHDDSKFSPEEYPHIQAIGELVQREGKVDFGTPEYEARKKLLGPMLEHHYANNDHHPEHFMDGAERDIRRWRKGDGVELIDVTGVAGMTLMALVEMFCDWSAAASDRNPDGALDIGVGCKKYEMPPMLEEIFRNTAAAMGIPHK